MKVWTSAALVAAVAGVVCVGALAAPAANAQSGRVAGPRPFEVFAFGGSRIGVSVSDLDTPATREKPASGVVVDTVQEGSPAEKAGLRKGDIIVEFDGERVRSVRQFTRLVSETPAGRAITTAVQRDGQRISVTVTPTQAEGLRGLEGDSWRVFEELRAMRVPRPPDGPRAPRPPAIESRVWRGGNQLGVVVETLSPQLAEYFGTTHGVLVSSVNGESTASKMGLKAGDVITSVNGTNVDDAAELRRALQRIEKGADVTVAIVRDKKPLTLKGKIEAPARRRSTTRTIL